MNSMGSYPDDRLATDHNATTVRWHILLLLMGFAFLGHFNRISISVAGTERIMKEYELTTVQMGSVYSAYLVIYTLFMIPGGWLIDRNGAKFALVVMGVGSGLFVILTGCVGYLTISALVLPALWSVRALTGLASHPLHPAAGRSVGTWMPWHSRAMSNGLVNASALIGIASTFYVFGALIDWIDWPLAFMVSGLATVGLALVWMLYASNSPAEHAQVNAAELSVIASKPARGSVAHGLQRSTDSLVRASDKPQPCTFDN